MSVVHNARIYVRHARNLSRYWHRSFAITAAKLIASRLLYQRGPNEFDGFRFINKPLRDWNGYTTERELSALQAAAAPEQFRYLEEDKLAFAVHCAQSGLRTAPIIATVERSPGARREFAEVPTARSGDELASILAAHGDFDGFTKPRCGGIGYGAFGFGIRNAIVTFRDGMGSVHDLFARCASSPQGGRGYVLQARIRPHPALTPWMPGPGLGTIRVLTFLQRNGEVRIPRAFLKMPAANAECDNLHYGSLVASVAADTGVLGMGIGATDARPVMHAMARHPNTGATIAGAVVPLWPEVRALVIRAARAFDKLPALGWDVAIDEHGPLLLEANVMFSALERALDSGAAEEFRALFAEIGAS